MSNLITFREFTKLLKANPNTVKSWKRRGDLPQEIFLKIGGTLYIKEDKFNAWVEQSSSRVGA